jgi:hypothetical protein
MFEAVVDRFLTKSPLTVMARLVLDRVCDPTWVDQVFLYIAADLRATYEGLAIAVPEAYWARYAEQSDRALAMLRAPSKSPARRGASSAWCARDRLPAFGGLFQ